MTFVGKTIKPEEIEFITYVMRLSGATERQFVRAAVLHYCDNLMQRARDLQQKDTQMAIEQQMMITNENNASTEIETILDNVKFKGDEDARESSNISRDFEA